MFLFPCFLQVSTREGIYATLPKSLTAQDVLVRCRQEDPETQRRRRDLVQSKSVSELAQIASFSDLPVPNWRIFQGGGAKKKPQESDEPDRPKSQQAFKDSLVSSIPF